MHIIGDLDLDELGDEHVREIRRQCRDAGLSNETTRKTLNTLQAMIRDACNDGDCSIETYNRVTAARKLRTSNLGRDRTERMGPWTPTEAGLVLDTYQERFPWAVPYVTFLLGTGCRVTEALGLVWDDLDLETGVCAITRSRDGAGAGAHISPGKTAQSLRTIRLAGDVLEELRSLRRRTPDPTWSWEAPANGPLADLDFVFRGPTGAPLDEHNFSNRQHRAVMRDLAGKVADRPLRCTRHTFIAHQLNSGNMQIPDAARYCGHDQATMLRKYYAYTQEARRITPDAGLPINREPATGRPALRVIAGGLQETDAIGQSSDHAFRHPRSVS
jgi:integrase